MKRKESGLTLVEILTVLAIVAILAGLLVPAVAAVKRHAKEVAQRVQLNVMDVALESFKNDYGDYPPSNWSPVEYKGDYCGAQKLAEALLGRDLLGFHPNSNWSATDLTWYPDPVKTDPIKYEANLRERRGQYLELTTARVFRLGNISPLKPGLFAQTGLLAPDTYVLCDVFGWRNVPMPNAKPLMAGAPILYYKANPSEKNIRMIYDIDDNAGIIDLKEQTDGKGHPLGRGPYPAPYPGVLDFFYGILDLLPAEGVGYIQDPKVSARRWPYRANQYLLISAGADGMYGTKDDICNFDH